MLASAFAGFGGFFILGLICVVIGVVALLASKLLGPKRPTRVKQLPYECGVEPIQPGARERYSVHFYLVAILFILFDLETVFLIPWAASFRGGVTGEVKVAMLVEVLAFVAILGAGLLYVWKRRGLEWD
ncbi:MAG: NADH-quinone oxidoreductase subunit A [Planctomycetota bacterium]|nr:MAG: NADH-quinone oxidoreductase subunit A [Planctomycetota bacterium]